LAREHTGTIDLLLTDVVMPEMNGRELAARLAEIRPGLRRLFMSGYTADVIASRGVLEEGVEFVQKPFTRKRLVARIRQVLDRQEAPA
jgi:FixJ family two-component response regulator